MDIMHACDFCIFPMAKKRKEKASKRLVYPNMKYLEPYFSQNLHHNYLHSKKYYSKYSICVMSLHSKLYSFLLCNSKLMGM
jgi:hypothetical protein